MLGQTEATAAVGGFRDDAHVVLLLLLLLLHYFHSPCPGKKRERERKMRATPTLNYYCSPTLPLSYCYILLVYVSYRFTVWKLSCVLLMLLREGVCVCVCVW